MVEGQAVEGTVSSDEKCLVMYSGPFSNVPTERNTERGAEQSAENLDCHGIGQPNAIVR